MPPFLYEELDTLSRYNVIKQEIPDSVVLNLNPVYTLRPYQIEAFSRFFHCYKHDFPHKSLPLHLLFNMATGSGKTLIMAGLILFLYEQGYRNFLFFVNSTNIIEKTRDNFLNPTSSKYLFNKAIVIDNRRVTISSVSNFEGVNPEDINICFTTIQKLHSDLTVEKENSLTFEDFRKHRIVLISDESHHMNVSTKAEMELYESWENTVQRIFAQNRDNLLLEFTATHDFATPAIINKYLNKVIYRYDLPQFRNDRYSKDVTLIYSDFDLNERILQALILNQYKQEVAAKNRINLKPVILFKAQRTIAQSLENKANFHKLIENLSAQQITKIQKSNIPIVKKAFQFFSENGISNEQLAERLKNEFRPEFCLSVNDDKDKETHQILVNTLEDKDNRIRAIFAVQKLNEGWDVLNLFDIVRCYEKRDSGQGVIGRTTTSEAQLIGRGARYFPFVLPNDNDRYRRKFDRDLDHELRVIEELHYHSINDSRYIAEIREALIKQGMLDPEESPVDLKLKAEFKKKKIYKYGLVYTNKKSKKDIHSVKSFADLGVTKKNYSYTIATGRGGANAVFDGAQNESVFSEKAKKDIPLDLIDKNIKQSAIARNPFFTFKSLKQYFPNLKSIAEFITSKDYLGGLEITFQGNIYNLDENRIEKLNAMLHLLDEIEKEVRLINENEYEGSKEFYPLQFHEVFKDKSIKIVRNSTEKLEDAEFKQFITNKDWYAFDALYGTSEETAFVEMLDRHIEKLQTRYEDIYLIRNAGHFAIYNFSDGQAFQPDFVLFLKEKNGRAITYQLFIEPKGAHLTEHDRWKETFLKEIKQEYGANLLVLGEKAHYKIIGVPFYNNNDENEFRDNLDTALQL